MNPEPNALDALASVGPREKALREMREAKLTFNAGKAKAAIADLHRTVAVASQKRGKPRRKPKGK